MRINSKNYYSPKANREYLSVSQYKDFCGSLGEAGCEAKAIAKLKGEWQDEITTARLIGSYVDAWFEGTLKEFMENAPELFNKNGSLKADFIKANEIIERVKRDPVFMKYMSGKKQKIMTAELFNAKWKIKMDSFYPEKCIVDLKVVKDIHESKYVKDYGYTNFIDYWGYDIQGAVYQEVVRLKTGKLLPFYIACVDKQKVSDLAVVQVDNIHLEQALLEVSGNVQRILDLKAGKAEPDRCEKCDYCKSTKKLTNPIHYSELIEN